MRDERPEESTDRPQGDMPTLAQLRLRAAQLKQRGLTYRDIADVMGTTAIRARDLCKQYERLATIEPRQSYLHELSRRALMALLTGSAAERYAPDVDVDQRVDLLVEIAASYDRKELLKEQFVGQRTCREIEAWLLSKGRTFRSGSPVQPAAEQDHASTPPAFHESPPLTGVLSEAAKPATRPTPRSTARVPIGKPARAVVQRAGRRNERSMRRLPTEWTPAPR